MPLGAAATATLEAPDGGESIEEVEEEGHDVHGDTDEDPEGALERLEE